MQGKTALTQHAANTTKTLVPLSSRKDTLLQCFVFDLFIVFLILFGIFKTTTL